jgi:hypothetical protein
MPHKYSIGSRRPKGFPLVKTREDGRQVVINSYATLRAIQAVTDVLNQYAYQEVKPAPKKPKEEQ